MNEFPLMHESEGVPLFYPHVPKRAIENVTDTLSGRWIGQGPKVDLFERVFADKLGINSTTIAVSSGTAALHLAYTLAEIGPGDEVICPVFTCTATNLPVLYNGGVIRFCDVAEGQLNIDIKRIQSLITNKTKAISVVDYGGKPNDYIELRRICDQFNLKLIADCAHALDGHINDKHVTEYADYVIYSFQAIKTLTTGDGGMLVVKSSSDVEKAKRIRWFGIDRTEKQKGTWENDIKELGYKYQMTDIAASIGLAALDELDQIFSIRNSIAQVYREELSKTGVKVFEFSDHPGKLNFTPWMITIDTRGKRLEIMEKLRENSIESAQVHYRNDRYSVFGNQNRNDFPNMNALEDNYLVLPLHTKMQPKDAVLIAKVVSDVLN